MSALKNYRRSRLQALGHKGFTLTNYRKVALTNYRKVALKNYRKSGSFPWKLWIKPVGNLDCPR